MQRHSLLELVKKATVSSSQRSPAPTHSSKLPQPPTEGPQIVGEKGPAPLPPGSASNVPSRAFRVPRGLRPAPLAHLRALAAQGGASLAAAGRGSGSSWPQHQQPVASTAWPRLGHLPTGRGRGLRRSGRSGSGARISGSHGLCRLALGSASSGMGGGRGRRRVEGRIAR